MRFFGLDLTDPYPGRGSPRPTDVAVIDDGLSCTFAVVAALPLGGRDDRAALHAWFGRSAAFAGMTAEDVFVLDGPQALAAPTRSQRACERAMGAPGRTSDLLPAPGERPFAGYVRGSVLLFAELVRAGGRPLTDDASISSANVLEAYPGGSWTALAGERLPAKSTGAGIARRRELLEACGVKFRQTPTTHDQLDAALCAYLGWLARNRPAEVTFIGEQLTIESGVLREGRILQFKAAAPRVERPRSIERSVSSAPRIGERPRPAGEARWVYLATPAGTDRHGTIELAFADGYIHRSAHNVSGARIANVQHVRAGDELLLCYTASGGGCDVLGRFVVLEPDAPAPGVPALQLVRDPQLATTLQTAGYEPDRRLGCFTTLLVELVEDLRDAGRSFARPGGQNALRRAEEIAGL